MKKVIGIVGEIAAGKTTITKYLKEKYDTESSRFSDSLRDVLKRMYLQQTRHNLQILSTILRENFGQSMISDVMKQDIENKESPIVITEGMRRPSDMTSLVEAYKDGFYVIYIKTDDKLRYERLINRSENPDDQSKTWEEFQKECGQESELKIKEIAEKANFVIDNNGTLEELYAQVDKIIEKMKN